MSSSPAAELTKLLSFGNRGVVSPRQLRNVGERDGDIIQEKEVENHDGVIRCGEKEEDSIKEQQSESERNKSHLASPTLGGEARGDPLDDLASCLPTESTPDHVTSTCDDVIDNVTIERPSYEARWSAHRALRNLEDEEGLTPVKRLSGTLMTSSRVMSSENERDNNVSVTSLSDFLSKVQLHNRSHRREEDEREEFVGEKKIGGGKEGAAVAFTQNRTFEKSTLYNQTFEKESPYNVTFEKDTIGAKTFEKEVGHNQTFETVLSRNKTFEKVPAVNESNEISSAENAVSVGAENMLSDQDTVDEQVKVTEKSIVEEIVHFPKERSEMSAVKEEENNVCKVEVTKGESEEAREEEESVPVTEKYGAMLGEIDLMTPKVAVTVRSPGLGEKSKVGVDLAPSWGTTVTKVRGPGEMEDREVRGPGEMEDTEESEQAGERREKDLNKTFDVSLEEAAETTEANVTFDRPQASVLAEDSQSLARLGLLHEAALLEKDKELASLGLLLSQKQEQERALVRQVRASDYNNTQMERAVVEYEKTIRDLLNERSMEKIRWDVLMEAKVEEKNQMEEEVNKVRRASADIVKKYERMKERIGQCVAEEAVLKEQFEELRERLARSEDPYHRLKAVAEQRLMEVNSRLVEVNKSKSAQIEKLKIQLRKVSSHAAWLEKEQEQKEKENQELSKICDELITKMGH